MLSKSSNPTFIELLIACHIIPGTTSQKRQKAKFDPQAKCANQMSEHGAAPLRAIGVSKVKNCPLLLPKVRSVCGAACLDVQRLRIATLISIVFGSVYTIFAFNISSLAFISFISRIHLEAGLDSIVIRNQYNILLDHNLHWNHTREYGGAKI